MTSEIVYLTHAVLITCVVEAGKSGDVIQAASSAGAKGSFVNYAKGQGIKESMGLIGVTIDNDKEVVRFIVSEEQAISPMTTSFGSPCAMMPFLLRHTSATSTARPMVAPRATS